MDPKLYNAAISGSNSFSEKISGDDFNPQLTSQGRNSILHIAAKSGKRQIAQEILNKLELQSLLYEKNLKDNTPLHIAARLGHFGMVKLLVNARQQECEVNEKLLQMKNQKNDTALHDAVRNGHFDIVKFLIEKDPDLASITNSDGESPLFLAVDREYYRIAQHILDKVPQCSYGGRNRMNVLHAAVLRTPRRYQSNIIEKKGPLVCADRSMTRTAFVGEVLKKNQTAITDADEIGWIPLHYAACLGSEEVVKLFMNFDTSLAYKKDNEGMSAFHIASKFGNFDVARTLIGTCPDTSELLDNEGRTALHVAAENGKRNVVKFFLKTPAFQDLINEQDNNGNTPLHLSAIKGHYDLLILLADDKKVDKGAMNADGLTTIDIIQSDKRLPVFQRRNIIEKLGRENVEKNGNNGQFEENERREPAEAGAGMDAANTAQENEVNNVAVGSLKYKVSDVVRMADVNLIVATLIATVTFQAAFQVPGGYNQSGYPNFIDKSNFKWFLVADSLAFSFSVASIFIHFFAVWVPKASGDTYPVVLLFLLNVVSFLCMSVAFFVGIMAVLPSDFKFADGYSKVIPLCFGFPICYFCLKSFLLTSKFKYSQRSQQLLSLL